ncbi:hypothetical protein KZC51_09980 [Microbacterium sp. SSW1-49]|uniref:Uncharacterized protein n=1 Tax=Microbacterium croceum TaxID=2851645 RepID=A0ABT0FEG8_9MICO|nr:hypothetical protein [Microbacterium croceum]MCK2036465.1 hypothetical protein [Microbacterium croceum]
MLTILLLASAPIAVAAIVAIGIRLINLPPLPRIGTPASWLTAAAGGIPALTMAALVWFPFVVPPLGFFDLDVRSMAPLALGIAAVVVLAIPPVTRHRGAVAQISRRTIMSFVSVRWIITALAVAAIIVALSVAAGNASGRDENGRYTTYTISIGTTGTEMGTGIYGWHYSVPALAGVTVLLVATAGAWALLPRPAWSDDIAHDSAVRRLRAANTGRAACGALLIHLAVVLRSLAGTASLIGSTTTTELGAVSVTPPFAALGPTLDWCGVIALTAGLAMWIVIALTAIPSPARQLTPVTTSAS